MLCTLRQMRYFVAVVEERSFRKAAQRLHVAQPALSRAVRDLEDTLTTPLLVRSSTGVEMTEAGRVFFEGCRLELQRILLLMEKVKRVRDGDAGELVVGYTDFAIGGILPNILGDFRSRFPRIQIILEHMVTGAQIEGLASGTIDVGFGTGPVWEHEIEHLTVQSEHLVAVISETDPLTQVKALRLEQLANKDFIMGHAGTWRHFWNHVSAACNAAGFVPRVVQEAYNSEGIFGLVAANMGITLHVESARNYIRKGLVVRDLAENNHLVETVARWRSTNGSAPLKTLVSFLEERVASTAPDRQRDS